MLTKKSVCFIILFFIFTAKIYSQAPTLNPFFFGEKSRESKVLFTNLTSIGKYYADPNWNAGKIYLENGDSLIAYYMRYDLIRNHLEVIIDTKIVAINGSFIDRFEWFSIDRLRPERFVNKKNYSLSGVQDISRFPELLEDGAVKLFKCKIVFAPRQATSPTLVNDTDKEVQVLEKYYYEKSGQLFEITNSKRKNLDFLDSPELENFIKKGNLKFNSESDLIRIVQYANDK